MKIDSTGANRPGRPSADGGDCSPSFDPFRDDSRRSPDRYSELAGLKSSVILSARRPPDLHYAPHRKLTELTGISVLRDGKYAGTVDGYQCPREVVKTLSGAPYQADSPTTAPPWHFHVHGKKVSIKRLGCRQHVMVTSSEDRKQFGPVLTHGHMDHFTAAWSSTEKCAPGGVALQQCQRRRGPFRRAVTAEGEM